MFQAIYDAEDQIPAEIKSFYVMSGGKWRFNGSMFTGLAEMLNPALDAKKVEILGEKKALQTAFDTLKATHESTKSELEKFKLPGSIVVDKKEIDELESYRKIGPVADIEKKVSDFQTLQIKVENDNRILSMKSICDSLSLNSDVVVDFMNSERGKGLELISKDFVEKDRSGKDVTKKVPFFKITRNIDGKSIESEMSVATYFQEQSIPSYIKDSFFATQKQQNFSNRQNGITVPTTGPATKEPDSATQQKSRAERFNEQRSTRVSPFAQIPNNK